MAIAVFFGWKSTGGVGCGCHNSALNKRAPVGSLEWWEALVVAESVCSLGETGLCESLFGRREKRRPPRNGGRQSAGWV